MKTKRPKPKIWHNYLQCVGRFRGRPRENYPTTSTYFGPTPFKSILPPLAPTQIDDCESFNAPLFLFLTPFSALDPSLLFCNSIEVSKTAKITKKANSHF